MPNWSYNRMIVRADTDAERKEVQRLRDAITEVRHDENGDEYTTYFSFNKIIPMPEELEDTTSPSRKPNQDLIRKYGVDNWYDWRCEHWGVKWDAHNTAIEMYDKDEYEFSYQTPWSFPVPVVKKLSEMFPTLTFTHMALEESDAYDFIVEFRNGEITYFANFVHHDDEDGEVEEEPAPADEFWELFPGR